MVVAARHEPDLCLTGGDGGAARILTATTYREPQSINPHRDADGAMAYDTPTAVYVTNGGQGKRTTLLTGEPVIDTEKGRRVNEFRVRRRTGKRQPRKQWEIPCVRELPDRIQIAFFDRALPSSSRRRGKFESCSTQPLPLILSRADQPAARGWPQAGPLAVISTKTVAGKGGCWRFPPRV